jgi:hypothetical protein
VSIGSIVVKLFAVSSVYISEVCMSLTAPEMAALDRFRESLQIGRCPFCFLQSMFGWEHLTALLGESSMDPLARLEMRASSGFCSPHAWRALERGDQLGVAVTYGDLLNVDAAKLGKKSWFARKKPCPVCKIEKDIALTYAKRFIHWWKEVPEFRAVVREKGALCLPHMESVLERAGNGKVGREIKATFLEGLTALEKDVATELADQTTIGKAWKEAVRRVAGDKR